MRRQSARPGSAPRDLALLLPVVHRFVVIRRHQDLARLGPVRGPDDAVALHHVHEPPGPAETYAEAALQHARRSLLALHAEAHRLVEQLVAVVGLDRLRRALRLAHGGVEGRLARLPEVRGRARALLLAPAAP